MKTAPLLRARNKLSHAFITNQSRLPDSMFLKAFNKALTELYKSLEKE